MSTSTADALTSPTTIPTTTQTPIQPLLPIILPYILSFLRQTLHFTLILPKYTISLCTTLSHSAIITPLTYILAPFFSFGAILFSITLGAPYQFLTWLLEALFPLYVFCGVACITGGLLGFGGRVMTMSIVKSVSEEREREKVGYYEETMKSKEFDPNERSAKRRRVERDTRYKVEFELDDDDDDSYWYEFVFS
ncbi:hypothetical protein AN958_11494 [Leucoagaricus sp. SymC.cos]|nr:hypothetical protein AN958_11494 [Leucoagaricus sp. SymC.cos]